METSFEVTVDSHFTRIMEEMRPKLRKLVHETAAQIAGTAQDLAPVDTGALRESIHVVSAVENGYEDAVNQASDLRPEVEFFDELKNRDDLEAIVAVAAPYGIYLEFGTIKMPAQPFLTPAVESVRASFELKALEILNNP